MTKSMTKSRAKYVLIIGLTLIGAVALYYNLCPKSGTCWKLGAAAKSPYQLVSIIGTKGRGNGHFISPRWLCVDGKDNLYVCDFGNNRIEKFSPQGKFLTKWGSAGSGPGEFNQPAGLAIHQEQIFVVDSKNSRVQVFDLEGTFLEMWGMQGREVGGFCSPLGIAIDEEGNVFVGDIACNRVQKFDPDGKFLATIIAADATNHLIPYGLAITPDNNLLVVDVAANIVRSFRGQGALSWALGQSTKENAFGRVLNVTSDLDGNIFVVDSGKKQILKFSKDGDFITAFSGRGTGLTELKDPLGIAVDSAGNVYIADMDNNQVQKFSYVSAN